MPEVSTRRPVGSQVQNGRLVAERRDLIVAAALKVFRQKGFHVATTKDVAAAAGITQSNLYNYISSKDDILYLVCEHLVGLYHAAMDGAAARFNDPHARLAESLRAIISLMCSHKEELVLLYNDAHALAKNDRRLIITVIAKFIKRFEDLIISYEAAYGPIRLINKRLAANLLSFVPAVVALRSWDLAQHVDPAEVESGIFEFVLAGLGIRDESSPSRRE